MLHVHDAPIIHATQPVITYSLKQGIAKFGEAAKQAAMKKMKQLHDRECYMPINPKTMSTTEKNLYWNHISFLQKRRMDLSKADTVPMAIHNINRWTESNFLVHQL